MLVIGAPEFERLRRPFFLVRSDDVNVRLADQLRQAIIARKLSTYRLAKLTGLSTAVVSRLVNGGDVSLGSLERLAHVIDVRVVLTPADTC